MNIFLVFALFVVPVSTGGVVEFGRRLMMVQAIWRHGDRSPTETFKSDKFTVDYWPFGGGGWGQLTPTGMRQHMQLGRMIRERYITSQPFLSTQYNSQEVFVRSTDKNRTLLSAYSNMIGMYSSVEQNDNNYSRAGIDYPEVSGWPMGFVPIPVHTIEPSRDHLLDADAYCPLQDIMWDLAEKSDKVKNYYNTSEVKNLLAYLTSYCGEEITPDNLWIVFNALKIEMQNYPQQFLNFTPWYTDAIFEQIDIVNSQVQDFQNGLGLEGILTKGVDIGKTLKKIRGGTLINDLVNHMLRKKDCAMSNEKECTYTNNLKFVAYSAHDTTIYALLSVLGVANQAVQPRGYPLYSACVLIEYWQDNYTQQDYFKLIYHRSENDTLSNVITSFIPGCPQEELCPLSVLQNYSQVYKPDMEMNKWCYQDIFKTSSSSLTSSPMISALVLLIISLI